MIASKIHQPVWWVHKWWFYFLIYLFIYLFIDWLIDWLIDLLIYLFIFFFIHLFIYLFSIYKLVLGQSIQEWTQQIFGRQPLKNLKWYGLPRQILLSPFLNSLSYLTYCFFFVLDNSEKTTFSIFSVYSTVCWEEFDVIYLVSYFISSASTMLISWWDIFDIFGIFDIFDERAIFILLSHGVSIYFSFWPPFLFYFCLLD